MITKTAYKNLIVTLWQSEIEDIQLLVSQYEIPLVIEMGTYQGGSAMVLADAGARVITYDVKNMVEVKDDRIDYRVGDVFALEHEIAGLLQADGLKMLFSDNGDKKREINTFAKYLNPDDFLIAHDHPMEWRLDDVQDAVKGFIPVNLPHPDRLVAWRKIYV